MSGSKSQVLDGASARISGRAWGVLFIMCGAIFLEGIDVGMLNVALPSIRADLGVSTGELQWVISAYVLGYGGFMLFGGRAADLFGRRRMFMISLVVFLAFSGLGGLATDGWMLILARFVTGVASAFMTPAGLSIITTTFNEGPQRNKALMIYSGTAAGGFSIGLVAGGLLAAIDWRWVFFAPVIMSFAILVTAVQLVPKSPTPDRAGRTLDLPGALTVTGGILLLVFTVERITHASPTWTVVTLVLSLALFIAFVAIERKSPAPLVRLNILRSGSLVRTNLAALLFIAAFSGFQFIAVLYLQELRGWSPVQTSLALLALGIDTVLAPLLTPRLVNRFGHVRVTVSGMALAALAYALFLPVGMDWTFLAMLPTMIILGVAFALVYGSLTIAATNDIADEEQGVASGLLYTSIQFGAALGLAAVTAVNVAATGGGGSPEDMLDGYRAALVVPLIAAVIALVIVAFGLRSRSAQAIDRSADSREPAGVVP